MQARRGIILVIVLVVVVLLTLSVFTFSKFMTAQQRATNTILRQTQVRLLAQSGIEYLRFLFFNDQYTILDLGGLYDNPDNFCGHIITDGTISMSRYGAGTQVAANSVDYRDVGRFSVIATAPSEDGILTGENLRYGLEDESAKINLRWILQIDKNQPGLGRMILMRLPGVNEEIADSILDWIDDSSMEPREFGAKDEYYTSLDPPYYTRNGIPDSLDELLNVRGITPNLLYGIDWNRNGIIDLGEPDESILDEYGVSDRSLNLGLISYLTLDSRESMITPEGLEKINVNMEDTAELQTLLEERFPDNPDWAVFIVSFRQQAGQATSSTGGQINGIFDLIGAEGSPFEDDVDAMIEYGPLLWDNLTTSDVPIVGRININQAARTVLEILAPQEDEEEFSADAAVMEEMLTGLTGASLPQDIWEIIDGIVAERISDHFYADSEMPEMNYPFWLYTSGIITDLATMRQLEPYICTQGAVYKATIIGRFDERSPVSRWEVWLDSAEGTGPARVIRIRDISDLGPGYSSELLGSDMYAR